MQGPEAFCFFHVFLNCVMLTLKMLQYFENIVAIYQHSRIGAEQHKGAL
jgi:hypothetical protein